ncbi:MAG: hypothetical protein AB7N91_18925 [Candidatus Tectimicrobiota bacterium]
MQAVDRFLTTQVTGHGRFLCVTLPEATANRALVAALDHLGADMENIFYVDGAATPEALQRGRWQFLRAEPALSSARDLPHPALLQATFLVHLEAATPEPLERYEAGLRELIGARQGRVETLRGMQKPRSYTSYAMTQFAYAPAQAPRPGTQCPLGVVTPQNKTAAWWRMDWMRRESFFLPRYDDQGTMRAQGHALAAAAGIPCITRRLLHHPEGYGSGQGYDFIGYFEFAEADAAIFRSVMAGLRHVAQNPEWAYVQEGPEWWGRRVACAAALWER